MTPAEKERRRIFAEADGVDRADAGLRQPFQLCRRCDGGGYEMGRAMGPVDLNNPYAARAWVWQPVKCGACGGEGLDPDSVPRARR